MCQISLEAIEEEINDFQQNQPLERYRLNLSKLALHDLRRFDLNSWEQFGLTEDQASTVAPMTLSDGEVLSSLNVLAPESLQGIAYVVVERNEGWGIEAVASPGSTSETE